MINVSSYIDTFYEDFTRYLILISHPEQVSTYKTFDITDLKQLEELLNQYRGNGYNLEIVDKAHMKRPKEQRP